MPLVTSDSFRYHLMRLPSRQWLDRDAPLSEVSITPAINGPGAMSASLPHEYAKLKQADGKPLIELYSTLVIAEADDKIRGGGIVNSVSVDGEHMTLEIDGFSMYPKGQPMIKPRSTG